MSTAGGNVAVDHFEELDDKRYFPFSTGKVNAEEIERRVVETRALGDVPWKTGTGDGVLVEVDMDIVGMSSGLDVGADVNGVSIHRHSHGVLLKAWGWWMSGRDLAQNECGDRQRMVSLAVQGCSQSRRAHPLPAHVTCLLSHVTINKLRLRYNVSRALYRARSSSSMATLDGLDTSLQPTLPTSHPTPACRHQ